MLANCRHEILSGYDTPQEAMRHQRTETEVSDTSQDIVGIDDDTAFDNSDEVKDDKVHCRLLTRQHGNRYSQAPAPWCRP
ncbi:hypothetical protein OS493_027586 [Desmophyllum pertusum]|uniref:Uncharacterized protein n=1 Tax=Desmophyllum pertusum TaxID=174260 RepID=A0A9W9ZY80_9CNID|nr:hypothetical protein OS493_027586 [Desmophyllum pertusum]